jgi:uncharacterized protein with HEPN domain
MHSLEKLITIVAEYMTLHNYMKDLTYDQVVGDTARQQVILKHLVTIAFLFKDLPQELVQELNEDVCSNLIHIRYVVDQLPATSEDLYGAACGLMQASEAAADLLVQRRGPEWKDKLLDYLEGKNVSSS